MFLFREFAKSIFILPLLVVIFVQSVHGGAIQKVEYHDGVVEYDDDSSSLEGIPPRDQWFRVGGSRSSHQQRSKSVANNAQDIVALDSTRTRYVEDEDSPMEENRDRQPIQVEVRNHGRIGFQNDRETKKTGHHSKPIKLSFSVEIENSASQERSPEEQQMQQSSRQYNDVYDEFMPSDNMPENFNNQRRMSSEETGRDRSESDSGANDIRINPPPHEQVAKMARFIVCNSNWTSVATISTRSPVIGYPFANVFSVSDGPVNNSSGIPYMYMTPLDMSVNDLKNDSRASLTMSLAQSNYCKQQNYDPEDPRCAHVILTGRIVKVTKPNEIRYAQNAMYSRHPEMQDWPKDHGWFFAKLKIANILVLDYFGGAKSVTIDDYFNQSML